MTVRKLVEKYMKLNQQGYETIIISQVISDLRLITMKLDLRRTNKNEE